MMVAMLIEVMMNVILQVAWWHVDHEQAIDESLALELMGGGCR
jgi:hypothetical protein